MADLTIIYYTANSENPKFEANIQRLLVEASNGTPIISVSHKVIDLGRNICVGDVGRSGLNIYRQMLIGATMAETKYVCTAESDNLYPPGYFKFRPDNDALAFLISPMYMLFALKGKSCYFALKGKGSESAMVINRDWLIQNLQKMLYDLPQWDRENKHGSKVEGLLGLTGATRFTAEYPTVSVKTDNNLHRKTPHSRHDRIRELPNIGKSHDLLRRLNG